MCSFLNIFGKFQSLDSINGTGLEHPVFEIFQSMPEEHTVIVFNRFICSYIIFSEQQKIR